MSEAPEATEELRRAAALYGLLRRRSIEAARAALAAGEVLIGVKERLGHGRWMPALLEVGIAYDTAARLMRLVHAGVTAETLAEHGMRGALDMVIRPRHSRDAGPEPGPSPATGEDGKFGTGAKFEDEEPAAGLASAGAHPFPVEEAWKAIRERLRGALGEAVFQSWIAGCRMEPASDGVVLLAPSRFIADRVRQDHGARIRGFLADELPGAALGFGVAESAPELPLPAGAGESPKRTLLPAEFSRRKPADRMLLCQTLERIELPQARAFLTTLAYFDGGKGAFASVEMLAAHHNVNRRTIQRWADICEAAGYLRKHKRRNRVNRYEVFPGGAPVDRQRRMVLLRTFDPAQHASAAERAESDAAAGVPPVSQAGGARAAPEGGADAVLNGNETGSETEATRRPAAQGRRRAAS